MLPPESCGGEVPGVADAVTEPQRREGNLEPFTVHPRGRPSRAPLTATEAAVQIIDPEILVPIVARFVDREGLTPSERTEVLRLAQGFACKESAAAAEISPETIRARRKRIYRKLKVKGASGVVAGLLGLTLELLVSGEPFAGPRLVPAMGDRQLGGDARTG